MTKELVVLRITEAPLASTTIIVAREEHDEGGYHFHAGVLLASGILSTRAPKLFREIFPEFEGAQLHVSFHKAWVTVCKYLLKEYSDPFFWCNGDLITVQEEIQACANHTRKPSSNMEVIEKRKTLDDWERVYVDPDLVDIVFRSYNTLRAVYEDMRLIKDRESSLHTRFITYLSSRGHPAEYTIQDLKEKYYLLDWIAVNVLFCRPIKTEQMLIYGEPSTQKTLIFEMLNSVLNIYHATTRKNDFTGAHDYYDLWLFDEFYVVEDDNLSSGISQAIMASTNNTLLRVLDGQHCRLDAKYGQLLNKKRNVTTVTITNYPSRSLRQRGPFHERLLRLKLKNHI